MSNSKIQMGRNHRKRTTSNSTFRHSLSRSRTPARSDDTRHRNELSWLTINDTKGRRASSASSLRSNSSFSSSHHLPEQIVTLSQTTQLTIPIERKIRECIICLTEKDLDEFQGFYGDTCAHIQRTVCNSCVYQNTKCLVEDSMIYFGDVTCPEPDCQGIFDYQGIREIIVVIGKNKTLFDKYDEHLIYRQLEQMPDFIWCAFNCGSGQIVGAEASSNPIVTCGKCNRRTCLKHRTVWHTDMTCDQYDILESQTSETDANKTWLNMFAKLCPQCQWHIQKNEGCDHMTCRYCKHEFCWECLADYKLIANKGSHHHQQSCTHFQPAASS